jgi:Skp family chaperone for outer membrane proteins
MTGGPSITSPVVDRGLNAQTALTAPARWGTSGGPSADRARPARTAPASRNDADPEKEFQVVKKSLACVAAVLAMAGGYGVWGTWVAAQPQATGSGVRPVNATGPAPMAPAAASAMPGTRVAVVNINKVLKNYAKAQKLNNDIRTKVQGYAKQINDKKEEIQKLQTELAQPTTTPQRKEQIEKQIVNLQRLLQDIDNEARKVIGKEQGDIAVQIFREIEGVIRAVATSNNFDIVFSYPDATDDADMYTQDNVVRKLAAQAAMPLFYKPHVDMTKAVIDTLNMSYPVAAATPTAPTAPRP